MPPLLENLWPLALLVALLALVFWFGRRLLAEGPMPYEKRPSLLTPAELQFFAVLREVTDGLTIVAMVRLADVIQVPSGTLKRQGWQNRIQAKHLDFVLVDPATFEPRLAIELDDSSHRRADRAARDAFVDAALADAGLPLLRVNVARRYNAEELRKRIDEQTAAATHG